jgi:hypothetical protein
MDGIITWLPHSPYRSPAWRWARATWLSQRGRRVRRRFRDDDWTLRARDFLLARGDGKERGRRRRRAPDHQLQAAPLHEGRVFLHVLQEGKPRPTSSIHKGRCRTGSRATNAPPALHRRAGIAPPPACRHSAGGTSWSRGRTRGVSTARGRDNRRGPVPRSRGPPGPAVLRANAAPAEGRRRGTKREQAPADETTSWEESFLTALILERSPDRRLGPDVIRGSGEPRRRPAQSRPMEFPANHQ